MSDLHTDVRYIKGIGEARAKALAKLGITDLLCIGMRMDRNKYIVHMRHGYPPRTSRHTRWAEEYPP